MAKPMTAAVVIGSLRKESQTRKVAKALIKLSPPELVCGRLVSKSSL